jgi:hypothetical protein
MEGPARWHARFILGPTFKASCCHDVPQIDALLRRGFEFPFTLFNQRAEEVTKFREARMGFACQLYVIFL